MFRRFSARVTRIDEDWFANPIQIIPLDKPEEYTTSADGTAEVSLPEGVGAYVKPREANGKLLMIAREKISADLGHLLKLPTAPVVVRVPRPDDGWVDYTMLSLAALPGAKVWSQGGAAHIKDCAPALEALRVFWTWIGDTDHSGNDGNLLYEAGTITKVLGIDHAFTLCHDNGTNPLTAPVCSGYGSEAFPEGAYARRVTVQAIERVGWNEVEMIVTRLDAILTSDEQKRILNILKERRAALPGLLGF